MVNGRHWQNFRSAMADSVSLADAILDRFENERLRTTSHVAFNDFKRVDVHLDLLALINGMKVRWRMVAIKHADDDSVEPA